MTTARSNLGECSHYVRGRTPFKASNMWGVWEDGERYVVYSYGYHFPMWVYDDTTGIWYGNSDKYSRSTSRQQGASNPRIRDQAIVINWFNTKDMDVIARWGYVELAARRLTGKRAA